MLFLGALTLILAALIGGVSGARAGRGWLIAFGAVSVIAGIVVAATTASSLNVLATLLGIWFVIMGIFEIARRFVLRRALRHDLRTRETTPV